MNALEEILRMEIAMHGAIPFARFMELALYHPEHGYYEREQQTIGRQGDYFTSVSVGGLFGELLASQFAEWLGAEINIGRARGETAEPVAGGFQIVEAGAHDGRLAADILRWLRTHRPELLGVLRYWIVEPSSRRQKRQEVTLAEFPDQTEWWPDFLALPRRANGAAVRGIIFSNELLDALPVHRLGWDARECQWFEWGVEFRDGLLAWIRMPTADLSGIFRGLGGLPDHLRPDRLPGQLLELFPDAFTIEVCPSALTWWREAGRALDRGKLLTIDYGFTAEEWLRPERTGGTLRAYHGHRATHELLANPGEQDLTAHINFSALQAVGESAGLRTEGLFSQGQFLVHALRQMHSQHTHLDNWAPERSRQFHTLIHPDQLGRAFRVLIQGRGN